jgi:hypothetical protein
MQTPLLALLPLLHICLVVVFVIAAAANVRKNPAVAGLLALMAAGFAVLTVWFFISFLHAA